MTLHALEFLLNETRTLRRAQELVGEKPGEKFNIFSILGMEADEVYTHSQFLSALLSPHGSHGLGDTFLNLLLNQLGILDFETDHAHCIPEHYIGPVTETEGGRIDILIRNKTRKVIIENKIFAGDQANQLLRYHNYDQTAILYYLTLFGTRPSEESTGRGQLESTQFVCLSYATDVLQWLEVCRKEAANVPILRETITQYIALIKKLTNQNFDGKMQKELVDKILSNPDNLTSFFELQSAGTTQLVMDSIIQKLGTDLQNLAVKYHLKLDFSLKTRKRWHGFTFSGNPDVDALQVNISFQFDQFPNQLNFGFSFPPGNEGRPAKPEFDLAPLIKAFKVAFPDGKAQDWWPCYAPWSYSAIDICNDIYFTSNNFIQKVEDKLIQMLEMARIAKQEILDGNDTK
jgi:hypothetical protein